MKARLLACAAGLACLVPTIAGAQGYHVYMPAVSQEQIAAAVGVSQMQVSRLLRASFEKMRQWMESNQSE